MRCIDNRARFFAVVGAPYVAKRHADAPAGSWLNDDR
jgi:hypothetical protein